MNRLFTGYPQIACAAGFPFLQGAAAVTFTSTLRKLRINYSALRMPEVFPGGNISTDNSPSANTLPGVFTTPSFAYAANREPDVVLQPASGSYAAFETVPE